MCVRVWWRICEEVVFATWLTIDSQLRPSRKWPTKPTACCFLECDFSHSLPTLYKSSLPTKCKKKKEYFIKKILREKPYLNTWELVIVLSTILYIISQKFPSTPTSPSTHPWQVLNPNTYLTHFECWEKFWCVWEHWKKPLSGGCNRAELRDPDN